MSDQKKKASPAELAAALRAANWSGVSIGKKALIRLAAEALIELSREKAPVSQSAAPDRPGSLAGGTPPVNGPEPSHPEP